MLKYGGYMENSTLKDNVITLFNRSRLTLTGVTRVISITPSAISVEAYGSGLIVFGSDMLVTKLDVESGNIEATGVFDAIKYTSTKAKGGLLKRILK